MMEFVNDKENFPSSNILENKTKQNSAAGFGANSKIRPPSSKFAFAAQKANYTSLRRALGDVKNVRLNENQKSKSANQEDALKKPKNYAFSAKSSSFVKNKPASISAKKSDSISEQAKSITKNPVLSEKALVANDDLDEIEHFPPEPKLSARQRFDAEALSDVPKVADVFAPNCFDKLFFGETCEPPTELTDCELPDDPLLAGVSCLDEILQENERMRYESEYPICDEVYLLRKEFLEMLKLCSNNKKEESIAEPTP